MQLATLLHPPAVPSASRRPSHLSARHESGAPTGTAASCPRRASSTSRDWSLLQLYTTLVLSAAKATPVTGPCAPRWGDGWTLSGGRGVRARSEEEVEGGPHICLWCLPLSAMQLLAASPANKAHPQAPLPPQGPQPKCFAATHEPYAPCGAAAAAAGTPAAPHPRGTRILSHHPWPACRCQQGQMPQRAWWRWQWARASRAAGWKLDHAAAAGRRSCGVAHRRAAAAGEVGG